MKMTRKKLPLFLFLVTLSLNLSSQTQFSGKINYSISYESNDPSLTEMKDILPSESYLLIKGDRLRFNQNIMGGGMQSFIVDKGIKSNILLMNFMGQEYKVFMSEEQVSILEKSQELNLIETNKTEVIQGFNCKHVEAIAKGDTLDIYYTEEIPTPAVLPQFASIKGLPLYYEVKKSGLKMTYKCTSIEKADIEDTAFSVSDRVKEIPFKEFAKNFAITK